MKVDFWANLKKLISKNLLFFVSLILILFYIAYGLFVREYFVSSAENKKIVADLIIYTIIFYASVVGFFALKKLNKKNLSNIKFLLAPGRIFFGFVSIAYLFSLTRLIYNNIQNIINELNYITDFIFTDFASYFGKSNINKTLYNFTNIIAFVSFLTLLLTTCFGKIAFGKHVFINFFNLKQKVINKQVINHNEIKGFLYKALP